MVILSKLADYGVIVATHLAFHPERQMTAAVLAQETNLPKATVAKLLKALAHGGIVTSARGAAGGYKLGREASTISVADVVAAIDGTMGVTQCTIHTPDARTSSCSRTQFCATRPHWHRINTAINAALGAITLAEMTNPFGPLTPRQAAPEQPSPTP